MKKLKKFVVIAKISFANAITYRASIISRLCFYTLIIYVFMNLWQAIYQEGNVHGYSHTQMVWYLIMTELITFAGGTNIYNNMNEEVKSGAIVYQLGRPIHYVSYQLANSIGQILLNLVGFGILASILGLLFVGPLPTFQLVSVPPLLLSIATSLVLNYFFLMLIGLSAFVVEDNFAFFLIYQKLNFMLGLFLPLEFLPAWLQPIAKSLPFSYIHWAPAKIFVSYTPEICWELIPRQALWMTIAVVLVLLCYRLSVRRLQVNGG